MTKIKTFLFRNILTQKVDAFPMAVKEVFLEHKDNPDDEAIFEQLEKVAPDTLNEVEGLFEICEVR